MKFRPLLEENRSRALCREESPMLTFTYSYGWMYLMVRILVLMLVLLIWLLLDAAPVI